MLLTDGRKELKDDLKQLKKEMEVLLQIYYRLEQDYKGKKKRFERIDREWALRDGRLKVVKEEKEAKETAMEKKLKEMTQEEIDELVKELSELVK
jgi:hypothetical protein